MTPNDNKRLEAFVHRTLRDLPPRTAPATLEARVQAEIARRASLPWWRRSFAHWPLAARGLFIVFCGGLVKGVLLAVVWITAGLRLGALKAAFAPEFAWVHSASGRLSEVVAFGHAAIGAIPPFYLYGVLAVVVSLYAALFGIGAAAYRTLYAAR